MQILALDVGGTAIKSALIGPDDILRDQQISPSKPAPAQILTEMAADVAKSYEDYDVLAVSMTGQIDHKRQMTLARSNGFSFEAIQFPVGEALRRQVKRPVFVLNDANAATLGEACYGAGRNYRNFICITYGTGVGGGIIQNGVLLTGHQGIAGELGHMSIHAGGRRCRCGRRGCYQEYASTTALLRQARKIFPELENGRELMDRLPGEPRLQRVLDKWIGEVAEGLCNFAYIFDPDCFVLGGGVMERQDILERVRRRFQKTVIPSFAGIQIQRAELGNNAGMLGAAAYARWALTDNKEGEQISCMIKEG